MSNVKEEVNAQKLYGDQSFLSKEDFIQKFHVQENGLTEKDVSSRISQYGFNEVKQAKPKKWYHYFLSSLFSPFNSILLGIACILFYTDVYLADVPSYANIIVIAILVTASTLLEFFEEYHSNQAAEKLKELVATTTTVIRNGNEQLVPIKQVVLGDIVLLSARKFNSCRP